MGINHRCCEVERTYYNVIQQRMVWRMVVVLVVRATVVVGLWLWKLLLLLLPATWNNETPFNYLRTHILTDYLSVINSKTQRPDL